MHQAPSDADVRALKVKALAYGKQVDAFSIEALAAQGAMQHENVRIFLLAHAVRMLRAFQAVCTLVAADLNDGAGAVLRSLLEQHYVFTAIHRDPDALNRLADEMSAEGFEAMKALMKVSPDVRGDVLSNERLQEAQTHFKQGSGFHAHNWAGRVGMADSYFSLWRTLCGYAHGSSSMIHEYLQRDQNGNIVHIRSKVAVVAAIEFVLMSSGMLVDAVRAVDTRPGSELIRARLDYFASVQQQLYDDYFKLRGDPLAELDPMPA